VELPSDGAQLQGIISEAMERDAAFRVEEQGLTAERNAIVDANIADFDKLAEQASREAEQELQRAVEATHTAQRAIRAAVNAWGTVKRSRIRSGRDTLPEMLPADFAGVARELEQAGWLIWPGHTEERWKGFQQREASSARRLINREPLLSGGR